MDQNPKVDFAAYQIPVERDDRFTFRGLELYMPRMAKAKTMIVNGVDRTVALCTGWDDPELILSESLFQKIALAAPMRSTFGINIFLANLALNPQIRKVVFLTGGEFDDTETGSLPQRVISALWKNGLEENGKIIGTEFSLLPEILENGGKEAVKQIIKNIELVDWKGKTKESLEKLAADLETNGNSGGTKVITLFTSEESPSTTLRTNAAAVRGGLETSTPGMARQKFLFADFKVEEVETLPSERTAIEIRASTGAEAWLSLLDKIIRYGKTTVLETKEGTLIRETPFVRVTIEDCEEKGFPVPGWLVAIPETQITPEELEAYYQRFIKPDNYYKEIYPGVKKFFRPPTDKYLYCELLFAFPRPKEVDKAADYVFRKLGILGVLDYLKDNFPVDEGKLAKATQIVRDANLQDNQKMEVLLEVFRPPANQVAELVKRIGEIGNDADKVLILWDPNVHSFLYSGRPCWVEAACLIRDSKLNFKAVFRSHDVAKGWIKNVYGIYRFVQEYLCQPANLKIGTMTIESESGHIYLSDLAWVKKLWDEQVEKNNVLAAKIADPRGNLLISVEGHEVEVVLASPEDGRPMLSFKGQPKDVLKQITDKSLLLAAYHWAYLGRELQKAEDCIKKGEQYLQDRA